MINAWLNLSVVGVFACLAIVYGAAAAIIAWLTFWSPLSSSIRGLTGIVAPYFNATALLFALLTGFLASDVVDRYRQAVHAVQVESSALSSLQDLTRAAAADAAPIREAVRDYLDAVVNDEWKQMANEAVSAKTEAAFAALLRTVADPMIAATAGPVVHNGFVTLALQAAAARSDRIAINSRQSDDIKWVTVLFLCLMTQIAIAIVHLERPRPHIAASVLFSVAAIVALGLIAIQENPFDGAVYVTPEPLERVLKASTN